MNALNFSYKPPTLPQALKTITKTKHHVLFADFLVKNFFKHFLTNIHLVTHYYKNLFNTYFINHLVH